MLQLLIIQLLCTTTHGLGFGQQEGVIVALADFTNEGQGCDHEDFDGKQAKDCCRMYIENPSVVVGRTWGSLPAVDRERWNWLQCDQFQRQLQRARQSAGRKQLVSHFGDQQGTVTHIKDLSNPANGPFTPFRGGATCTHDR